MTSHKLQNNTPEQLDASGLQDGSRESNKKEEIPDSQPPALKLPQKSLENTGRKTIQKVSRDLRLDTDQRAVYDALEDTLSDECLSHDCDNQVSRHYFSNALRESSVSCDPAAQTKSEECEEAGSTKRRRTTNFDYEEAAIYAGTGKETRGFVSAKVCGQVVAKKRSEEVK